jgi:hypothetical protein
MLFPRPLDLLHQITEAFPLVLPCAFGVDIAHDPRAGVGPRPGRREPEPRHTWRTGDPLVDGWRFMATGVSHDTLETGHLSRRGRAVQQRQESPKPAMVLTRAEPRASCASRQRQRPSQGGVCMGARGHERGLRALAPPGGPALRQEMHSACIRPHQDGMRLHVVMHKPHPGEPREPVWSSICGHALGAFPHPAARREPAAHGCGGHREALRGLERHGARGPAPPGAAPARDPWGFVEAGAERAREPGHSAGGLDSDRALPVWGTPAAAAPGALRPHDAVPTGA